MRTIGTEVLERLHAEYLRNARHAPHRPAGNACAASADDLPVGARLSGLDEVLMPEGGRHLRRLTEETYRPHSAKAELPARRGSSRLHGQSASDEALTRDTARQILLCPWIHTERFRERQPAARDTASRLASTAPSEAR